MKTVQCLLLTTPQMKDSKRYLLPRQQQLTQLEKVAGLQGAHPKPMHLPLGSPRPTEQHSTRVIRVECSFWKICVTSDKCNPVGHPPVLPLLINHVRTAHSDSVVATLQYDKERCNGKKLRGATAKKHGS
eukprot:1150104-Pelagomonas_calceolata.AAC.3